MRSTPCSGTALRTVCSGSVRGGSKVGRARAGAGAAAQSMKPLPRLAMGGHPFFHQVLRGARAPLVGGARTDKAKAKDKGKR